MLVDGSIPEAGENSNIESTESFKVFFPNGSMTSLNNGQNNVDEFQDLDCHAKECGFAIEFQMDLLKEPVRDFRDNNLVNACLLQFPFGRGGIHEVRMREDGSITDKILLEDHMEHLSQLSQLHFHFTLILYNLSMKQFMAKTVGWKVHEKGVPNNLLRN